MVAGQERVLWNAALSVPAKEFAFNNAEIARIKAALQTWDSYGAPPIGVGWNHCWRPSC